MIAISSTSRIGVNMTPTSACRTHSFNFLPLMSGGNTPSTPARILAVSPIPQTLNVRCGEERVESQPAAVRGQHGVCWEIVARVLRASQSSESLTDEEGSPSRPWSQVGLLKRLAQREGG